jgi:hypothetical protein
MRFTTIALCISMIACHGSPTEPRALAIADGRWTGDGACLLVRNANVLPHTTTLIAGCGHGEFPTPDIRSDGTFDVDGTFRIEAGPVRDEPPPPAHYSGSLTNTTLTLRVVPEGGSATTFRFHMDASGTCAPLCL